MALSKECERITIEHSNQKSSGFWELGHYKANTTRIREGLNQLNDLVELIRERISIESKYGTKLEQWQSRWQTYCDQQLENGTIKTALDGILKEGKELARVHLTVKDRFNDEVVKTIELYRKDNYHKNSFRNGIKEVKEIDDEFEKVQRQWKKLFDKVELSKKKYHELARDEKSANIQMLNTKSNSNSHIDSLGKFHERHERIKDELKKARAVYESNISELTKYNLIYKESMEFIFEKCQQSEFKRMKFFMEMLSGMQKVLVGLLNPPKLAQVHRTLEESLGAQHEESLRADLKTWSLAHGSDFPTSFPVFEECYNDVRAKRHKNDARTKQCRDISDTNGDILGRKTPLKLSNEATNSGTNKDANTHNTARIELAFDPRKDAFAVSQTSKICHSNLQTKSTLNPVHNSMPKSKSTDFAYRVQTLEGTITSPNTQIKTNYSLLHERNSLTDNHPSEDRANISHQRVYKAKTSDGHKYKPTAVADSIHPIISQKSSRRLYQPHNIANKHEKENDILATNDGFQHQFTTAESHHNQSDGLHNSHISAHQAEGYRHNNFHSSMLSSNESNSDIGTVVGVREIKNSNLMPKGPAEVIYEYVPQESDEIKLNLGEVVDVIDGPNDLGWLFGRNSNNETGLFPASYVSPMTSTPMTPISCTQ